MIRYSIPSILLLLLLLPFAFVWLPSSSPVADFSPAPSPEISWKLLAASIAVAAAAALLAVMVGSVIAGLLVTTDLPQPSFWGTAALLPFLCPPTVWALAQVHCFGPGGLLELVFWRRCAAVGCLAESRALSVDGSRARHDPRPAGHVDRGARFGTNSSCWCRGCQAVSVSLAITAVVGARSKAGTGGGIRADVCAGPGQFRGAARAAMPPIRDRDLHSTYSTRSSR